MTPEAVYPALRAHVRRFFEGHRRHETEYTAGPAGRVPSGFRAVRAAPGPRTQMSVYLSLGAFEGARDPAGIIEFVFAASQLDPCYVELLAMVAYYHRTEVLDVGHTVPLGGGLSGGTCTHLLVSRPYPFGPELEVCQLGDGPDPVRFLWLLPITEAEKRYRHGHGLEALEQRFDEARLNWAFESRESVV